MFARLMQSAERTALRVSRRQFLRRMGEAALATAGALAAVAVTNEANAAPRPPVVCNPDTSFTPCQGHLVGDTCRTSDGYGTCREVVKGSGQCGCAERKRNREK